MNCSNCNTDQGGNICKICDKVLKEKKQPKTLQRSKTPIKKVSKKLINKMNGKSLPKLKAELQEVFNKFIRLRDQKNGVFKCISCGRFKPVSQMNAGHYHSQGNNEAVRYSEINVQGQCIRCNCHLHGNLLRFQDGLIKKYGKQVIDLLEIQRHNKSKMGKFEHELLIKEYKAKVKVLERKYGGFYEPESLSGII